MMYICYYSPQPLVGEPNNVADGATLECTAKDHYYNVQTRHIRPPSEIDLGLLWADFTDLEGK